MVGWSERVRVVGVVWSGSAVMICSVHLHWFRFLFVVGETSGKIEGTLRGALGPKKTS